MDIVLLVDAGKAGQRLDRLLSEALPDRSRVAVQKAVEAGCCLVDGLPETVVSRRMKAGQEVRFSPPEGSTALEAEEGAVDAVWHDAHLLVCHKPAGLTVHPCPSRPSGTLVQRLLGHFPQLARQEGMRPGIVHRLDKDTSGLLLVALDEAARLALSGAFAENGIWRWCGAYRKRAASAGKPSVAIPPSRQKWPLCRNHAAANPPIRNGHGSGASPAAPSRCWISVSTQGARIKSASIWLMWVIPFWATRSMRPPKRHDVPRARCSMPGVCVSVIP